MWRRRFIIGCARQQGHSAATYLQRRLVATVCTARATGLLLKRRSIAFHTLQGTRFLLSGNKAGQVYLLDTSNPKNVKILDIYSTGPGSSPHYIVPIEKGECVQSTRCSKVWALSLRPDFLVHAASLQFQAAVFRLPERMASCLYPHTAGGNQFAVADYFLDQGAIGAVHAGGNKRVFVLEVRTCCM